MIFLWSQGDALEVRCSVNLYFLKLFGIHLPCLQYSSIDTFWFTSQELFEGYYFCQAQKEEFFHRAKPYPGHPTIVRWNSDCFRSFIAGFFCINVKIPITT